MFKNDNLYNRTDYSLHEFIPTNMQNFNAEIETQEHTYYFSIASSIRGKRMIRKQRDMMNEMEKTAEMGIGMDLEVQENIR
jgi:uncharacterized membrane protein